MPSIAFEPGRYQLLSSEAVGLGVPRIGQPEFVGSVNCVDQFVALMYEVCESLFYG